MISAILLSAVLTNPVDLNQEALYFLECGDQLLITNSQAAILTHKRELIPNHSEVQQWITETAEGDNSDCLKVRSKQLANDSNKSVDFNKRTVMTDDGYEIVFSFNDFGDLVGSVEQRENGREYIFVYDDDHNLIESYDSELGTTKRTKRGGEEFRDSYNHQGELTSSTKISRNSCLKRCDKLFDDFRKHGKTSESGKAILNKEQALEFKRCYGKCDL